MRRLGPRDKQQVPIPIRAKERRELPQVRIRNFSRTISFRGGGTQSLAFLGREVLQRVHVDHGPEKVELPGTDGIDDLLSPREHEREWHPACHQSAGECQGVLLAEFVDRYWYPDSDRRIPTIEEVAIPSNEQEQIAELIDLSKETARFPFRSFGHEHIPWNERSGTRGVEVGDRPPRLLY